MTAQTTDTASKEQPIELNFDALYRENVEDLYAYVAGILRDQSCAEETVAKVFEQAYRKRKKYSPKRGSTRSWLFTMARSSALDELRRVKRHAEPTDDISRHSDSNQQTEQHSINRVTLQSAIKQLTQNERELVALKFYAGLSNKDIAQVLGVSESNTGTLLHRTIGKIRKACNDSGS